MSVYYKSGARRCPFGFGKLDRTSVLELSAGLSSIYKLCNVLRLILLSIINRLTFVDTSLIPVECSVAAKYAAISVRLLDGASLPHQLSHPKDKQHHFDT